MRYIIALIALFIPLFLSAADWPIYKGNLYFTGNNDEIIIKNNSLKWLFMASNYIFNPVVSDGRVYFSDLDKIVYCLDEEKGTLLWKLNMTSVSSAFGSAAGVAGKIKYPLVQDNALFLSDATALYCLDKTSGKVLWARAGVQENDVKKFVIDGIYADPFLSGNRIYYGTRKNFIAREIANGHIVWTSQEIFSYSGFPTFYDDKIFTQTRDFAKNAYEVVCMQADSGKVLWRRAVKNPLQILSPVVYQNQVFIPSGKTLYCLSLSDGSILWEKEYEAVITANPGFTDRSIILILDNRSIAVIDTKNGSPLYIQDFGALSAPKYVAVQDQIYTTYDYKKNVGGKDITFASVRSYTFGSKNALWEFLPPFPGSASQPCAVNGVLFFPAGNYLYAVGTYYDKSIVFGNDGNQVVTSRSSSASVSSSPVIIAKKDTQSSNIMNSSNTVFLQSSDTALSSSSRASVAPERFINIGQAKKGDTITIPNIYFEFNESYLLKDSKLTLNDIAAQLKRNRNIKLEIRGHTDNVGERSYNQKLSEKRAEAVMNYLIKGGISPERLQAVGFGMDKPIADNATEEGRTQNRRTEFTIMDN